MALGDEKKEELEKLEGVERLEKAVALVIHALNTPIMVAEGYLPEDGQQDFDPKNVERVRRSVKKIQDITDELKDELLRFRQSKV